MFNDVMFLLMLFTTLLSVAVFRARFADLAEEWAVLLSVVLGTEALIWMYGTIGLFWCVVASFFYWCVLSLMLEVKSGEGPDGGSLLLFLLAGASQMGFVVAVWHTFAFFSALK